MFDLMKDSATDNYFDVERMLIKIAFNFFKCYGGDLSEWQSRANYYFMEANKSYDTSKKVKYSTWVYQIVHHRLQDELRKDTKAKQFRQDDIDLITKRQETNGLSELYADLSTDGVFVVDLIFNTPKELLDIIKSNNGKIRHVKKSISKYLKEIGWQIDKITNTFNQIEEIIND